MPSSSTYVTTDADEFRMAIRPIGGDLTVTGRGKFQATVTRVDFSRLWMQFARETLPRTWYSEITASRVAVSFIGGSGTAVHQGVEMHPGDISLMRPGEPVWQRLSHGSDWGSMSLPVEDWSEIAAVVAGHELVPARGSLPITPTASSLATLQRLHSATVHLAETAPELLTNPEVARGIEQGLIGALVNCLDSTSPRDGTLAQRRHTTIMTRFRRMLEERDDISVYVPEICTAIGVSERTIRQCCQEHLGISLGRYLYLRRMTFARRTLVALNSSVTSVTDIATQFGFWELGRFAADYRMLFGEHPSVTLQQAG